MKAIKILVEEHDLILKGLDLLTTASDKIVRDQNPPKEFFEMAIDFTFNFTNRFHHYKEEIVMFGLLAQKHQGELDAEIERLRNQHATLHHCMDEISNSLEAYSNNNVSEVRRLHRNLSEYIETLRDHVDTENRVFYPLVVKTLTEDEKVEMTATFEKYATKEGEDAMKTYGALIDEMGKLV